MKKTKILFFINTLNFGGAEKVLVNLVNHMDPAKFNITVKTVINSGIYRKQLSPHIRYQSIFPQNKLFSYVFSKFLAGKLNSKRFYRRYVADDYDTEVAFLEGFCTKILAASSAPNKIAWVHTDLFHYYGHENLFPSIEENRECYARFRKIVCVSESVKEGFIQQFGDMKQLTVLYNPIDEITISQKAREPVNVEWKDGTIRVLTVGRLVEQKGFDRLLRVHKRLMNENVLHQLYIIGDGVQRKTLETYISENNLSDSVKMLGFQENPYVYMKNADLFVCSSYVEGLSSVVAESLVCGTPVVSTKCSGSYELLGDSEYGLMVENEEEALYQGLKKLLQSPELLQYYRVKAQERGKMICIEKAILDVEDILK